MGVVMPPGLDIGHAGLGAARELISVDLEEQFVQLVLVDQEDHSVHLILVEQVEHSVHLILVAQVEHSVHLILVEQVEHSVQHHLPDAHHSMAVASLLLLLWCVDLHVPGTHAADTHHLGAATEDLHDPGTREGDTQHLDAVTEDLHGPGTGHHHGHPVEAPNHVLPHAVEFSQVAVQSVLHQRVPQRTLRSCQYHHLFSSSPWWTLLRQEHVKGEM
jgi:hypothetical protein